MVDFSRPVGWAPADPTGDPPRSGDTGRLYDPITGAGLFTQNTDPMIVGVDPLTGADAPTGTDVGFGAGIRRWQLTGLYNSDFAVPTPAIGSSIVSDPDDKDYNPLPWWVLYPASNGTGSAVLAVSSSPSGYSLGFTLTGAGANDETYIEQWAPVAGSVDRAWSYLAGAMFSEVPTGTCTTFLQTQYLTAAGTTTGSSTESTSLVPGILRTLAGVVPADGYWLRVRAGARNGTATATLTEVRLLSGPDTYLMTDRSTPANTPGSLVKSSGTTTLSNVASGTSSYLQLGATAVTFSDTLRTWTVGPVGVATRQTATGNISTTETQVVGYSIPAGSASAGTTYRVTAHGVVASSAANAVTFRFRCGPTTLTGNIAMAKTMTATTTAAGRGFSIDGLVTFRTVGASGTVIGNATVVGDDVQPFSVTSGTSNTTATVAADTTGALILELTCVTAAGTTTVNFHDAALMLVMP